MKPLVLFAHGKESGPWGSKIQHLASVAESHGCSVLSPDYTDLVDPDARVVRLLAQELPPHDRLILVGSSMGGYVSTIGAQILQPRGLFLMAPALYMPGYAIQNPQVNVQNIHVVCGWQDDAVPALNGIRFAQEHNAKLVVFDSDHRLQDVMVDIGLLFTFFLEDCLQK
jgi:pimeloyl-ACP methyl ester carboxylesterase